MVSRFRTDKRCGKWPKSDLPHILGLEPEGSLAGSLTRLRVGAQDLGAKKCPVFGHAVWMPGHVCASFIPSDFEY